MLHLEFEDLDRIGKILLALVAPDFENIVVQRFVYKDHWIEVDRGTDGEYYIVNISYTPMN